MISFYSCGLRALIYNCALVQDYKKNAFLEADKQCSNAIHNMEKKIRAACTAPGVKVSAVTQVFDQYDVHDSSD
jgi:hypothetical protein